MQGKVDRANAAGADLYVSIHNNGSVSRAARGTESFGSPKDPEGRRLARLVHAAILARTHLPDRRVKTADFYVLRWSNMPAVLVEGGFITSPRDAALLRQPAFRRRIALGIADGIARWRATDAPVPIYPRLSGELPEDVAVASSRALDATGAATVLLASADSPELAVVAAPLAVKLDAPLLLTRSSLLPTSTATELARLKPSRIVVLGSESAVDSSVASAAIDAAGPDALVERIDGDAAAASAAVARRFFGPSPRLALAPARPLADQLSAATWAARAGGPVLVDPGQTSLGPESIAATPTVLAVGAAGSSILPPSATVTRIVAENAWWNNAWTARTWSGRIRPVVANANDPATAVVAATHAARTGQPLLLLDGRKLPTPVRWFVTNRRGTLLGFTLVGTRSSLDPRIDRSLAKSSRL